MQLHPGPHGPRHHVVTSAALALAGLSLVGCHHATRYVTPERLDEGMVYILPGIEGQSQNNRNIQEGLADGGVPYALNIHHWGFPVPGVGLIVNQTNVIGNRRAAGRLADEIVDYQHEYPGRPVFLVGHSGGGGIAIFALEQLADRRSARLVEGAVLVSASLSANYDLTRALTQIRRGIVNVYNRKDTALLGVGTTVFGNVDGGRGASCGRTGFDRSYPHVFERDASALPGFSHTSATSARLIARRAPYWLRSDIWPPPDLPPMSVGW